MTDPDGSFIIQITRRRVFIVAAVLFAVLAATTWWSAERLREAEVAQLAGVLGLREGMTVGEIGAGSGWLTVEVARRIGPSGRVYSTELSSDRLDDIRQAASEAGLGNVTVLQAGERATNLPAGCCDAIFMRRVYHHLSDPSPILASIHDALRPGGRLVIIEFRSDGLLGKVTRMGFDRVALVDAVTAIGFEVVSTNEWPGWDHYVAEFRKATTDGQPSALSHQQKRADEALRVYTKKGRASSSARCC
jgi:precorrin-6B methylase 2